ncbi:MAG: hypothetical protein JWN04_584 [Myxococcaceae bacterium]|nr:hypothetical protein [Myxococcaceae bacterium]
MHSPSRARRPQGGGYTPTKPVQTDCWHRAIGRARDHVRTLTRHVHLQIAKRRDHAMRARRRAGAQASRPTQALAARRSARVLATCWR